MATVETIKAGHCQRKASIEAHAYVDGHLGVLAAMWRKRSRSYAQLGFTTDPAA
jgi:hypothetical protein